MNANPDPSLDRQREIFLKALEKASPAERAAYLDGACGEDLALRAQVEALLQHHTTDSFLESPVLAGEQTQLVESVVSEGPGTVIDRYKLLQQIGEGGMGVVYMAEQEKPVRRRVALKIIKLGMDTKQVVARFEAERQALALMDHPNIARVLDGGATETGRPYFVMELVQGVPITEFCDKNKLSAKGTHVGRCADHCGVIGEERLLGELLVRGFGDAEINHLRHGEWAGDQHNLSLSPDGTTCAVGTPSALGVDLWDPKSGRLLYSLPEQNGTVYWLAWSPNSQRLAVSCSNGEIAIWNLPEIDRVLTELGLSP